MSFSPSFFSTKGVTVNISGLTKRYRTAAEEIHALRGVDFQVKPGQAIAIMGPSGCGKTTLLNLLGGVDRPTQGQIKVDGEDLSAASERALEKYRLMRVGFIFQMFNLIPSISAFENIELPMTVAGVPDDKGSERVLGLLDRVGLKQKAHKRPGELSGGEQQRVAICVALANDPALLLADEPTGNLDSTNAASIAEMLCSLASDFGKTVLMVSHDHKVVEQFPIMYAMRDGNFVDPQSA
jgi:putative ABC transport system ATP-binding protein